MKFYQLKDGGLINLDKINLIKKISQPEGKYRVVFEVDNLEHQVYLGEDDIQRIRDYNDYLIQRDYPQ